MNSTQVFFDEAQTSTSRLMSPNEGASSNKPTEQQDLKRHKTKSSESKNFNSLRSQQAKPNPEQSHSSRWRYNSNSSVDSVFASQEHQDRDSWHSDGFSHRPTTHSRSSSFSFQPLIHSRSQIGNTRCTSVTSVKDVVIPLNPRQSQLANEALRAPRIHRTMSCGQELTREHWQKIKNMEDESERSQRCAKLSSGFAPIMMFGGLVFICIGISASTNTGKDKTKLKNLSVGPLTVGVFMILLAMFLILMWLCCRKRARVIDHKLLHGASESTSRLNFIQNALSVLRRQFSRTPENQPDLQSELHTLPLT